MLQPVSLRRGGQPACIGSTWKEGAGGRPLAGGKPIHKMHSSCARGASMHPPHDTWARAARIAALSTRSAARSRRPGPLHYITGGLRAQVPAAPARPPAPGRTVPVGALPAHRVLPERNDGPVILDDVVVVLAIGGQGLGRTRHWRGPEEGSNRWGCW